MTPSVLSLGAGGVSAIMAVTSADSAISSTSTNIISIDSGSKLTHGNSTIQLNRVCTNFGLPGWWYNSWNEGPYGCTKKHDSREWSMLRAYRSGGSERLHWIYTTGEDDPECMHSWNYYESDGTTLITYAERTTLARDSKRWCALPVYRTGGLKGKQWDYCCCCDTEYTPSFLNSLQLSIRL